MGLIDMTRPLLHTAAIAALTLSLIFAAFTAGQGIGLDHTQPDARPQQVAMAR